MTQIDLKGLKMGDWYEFEIRVINGVEVSGFCYQNKDTCYQEVFVEFTESQKQWANEWQRKMNELMANQNAEIKSWIKPAS